MALTDIDTPTVLYNDNDAFAWWSHNMTSKTAHQIELHEKLVCKWAHDKTIAVKHVSCKINPSDIFTKKMWDGTHFCHFCN
jgi:hypothetical protein